MNRLAYIASAATSRTTAVAITVTVGEAEAVRGAEVVVGGAGCGVLAAAVVVGLDGVVGVTGCGVLTAAVVVGVDGVAVADVMLSTLLSTVPPVDVHALYELYLATPCCTRLFKYGELTQPRRHPGVYGHPAPIPVVDVVGVDGSGHVPLTGLKW